MLTLDSLAEVFIDKVIFLGGAAVCRLQCYEGGVVVREDYRYNTLVLSVKVEMAVSGHVVD